MGNKNNRLLKIFNKNKDSKILNFFNKNIFFNGGNDLNDVLIKEIKLKNNRLTYRYRNKGFLNYLIYEIFNNKTFNGGQVAYNINKDENGIDKNGYSIVEFFETHDNEGYFGFYYIGFRIISYYNTPKHVYIKFSKNKQYKAIKKIIKKIYISLKKQDGKEYFLDVDDFKKTNIINY